ncbi:uncharacterized protein DEA37_0003959 [Paragonimus westermani]|uniref:Endonuclease/exonuclease/phosphatase domain-containing protein n=1 Tax=Paragonimus westermani TaxID=34504 RepID=A0A5J4NSX0_9TREM|nr:uncharacterized protein DEA37_0003959 [Paragonimus westermani]
MTVSPPPHKKSRRPLETLIRLRQESSNLPLIADVHLSNDRRVEHLDVSANEYRARRKRTGSEASAKKPPGSAAKKRRQVKSYRNDSDSDFEMCNPCICGKFDAAAFVSRTKQRADAKRQGFSAPKTDLRQARGRKTLTTGTWNVRTLLDRCGGTERPERHNALIAMELRRCGIDVAALSETRLADQGKLREAGAGYTFYWIGYPANSVRKHGICFAVADRINALMTGEPHGISPRMLCMRLRLGRGGGGGGGDIGSFNENGDRLLRSCATHELATTNTRFQLDASAITTWTHPRSGHHHLLDYVIVPQRDIRGVRITRVMLGAECSTDHGLYVYCRSFAQRRKLDIKWLKNSETKTDFQRAVVARPHNAAVSTTPDSMQQQLKKQITAAATGTIGVERKKRPVWFDDNNVIIFSLV